MFIHVSYEYWHYSILTELNYGIAELLYFLTPSIATGTNRKEKLNLKQTLSQKSIWISLEYFITTSLEPKQILQRPFLIS